MKIAIYGSGAVGGFYGALLARAGEEVVFLARGEHLRAIQGRGLAVRGPLGDFQIHAQATDDPAAVGLVDLVLFAVKTYDAGPAVSRLAALMGPDTVVLTLQNGIEAPDLVSDLVGAGRVLAGATYIATRVAAPGVIEQTGTHRRIVFGELDRGRSARAKVICERLRRADIQAELADEARVAIWEKFVYLAPFAAITGAARLPIGPIWSDPVGREVFLAAVREAERVGRAADVALPPDVIDRITAYTNSIPPDTKSSLLLDLEAGRRLEVEALQGAVVRVGRQHGVPTPLHEAFYAALRPHAEGRRG